MILKTKKYTFRPSHDVSAEARAALNAKWKWTDLDKREEVKRIIDSLGGTAEDMRKELKELIRIHAHLLRIIEVVKQVR